MVKLVWKQIADDGAPAPGARQRRDGLPYNFKVWRAKVTGGWLVTGGDPPYITGVAFMPDPDHAWDVEELKQPAQ